MSGPISEPWDEESAKILASLPPEWREIVTPTILRMIRNGDAELYDHTEGAAPPPTREDFERIVRAAVKPEQAQARDKAASRSEGGVVSRQGTPGDETESERCQTLRRWDRGSEHGTKAPPMPDYPGDDEE